jgi:F0F1-type ATP synthase membrane subunit b/b'
MNAKRVAVVLLLVPFLTFMTMEEGAKTGAGGSGMIGKVINFVILFGALIYFLRKPLTEMLVKKSEEIKASLEEARLARVSAEAQLAEARVRVTALEDEMARMKAQAAIDNLAETERITRLAEKEAERIRTLAAQEVAIRLQAGVRELKAYTADLAAEIAEARIKSRLTEADQAKIIDLSIEKLKKVNAESLTR